MRAWTSVVVAVMIGCGGSSDDAAEPDASPAPVGCGERPDDCVDACDPDGTYCDPPAFECTCTGREWVKDECSFPVPGCNPVAQAGCCAGEKCAFILDDPASGIGHTGCVATGSAAVGEVCTAPTEQGTGDSCAAGGSCFDGTCRAVCTTVNDTCADTTTCVPINRLEYDLCLPACDPIAQDCAGGLGCYVVSGNQPACVAAHADGEPGDACDALNDCRPGAGCAGDPATCHVYCEVAACPGTTCTCGDGEQCTALADGSPYGACTN